MTNMPKNAGFSLVELMVAMTLLLIVGAAGLMVFVSAQSVWSVTKAKVEMQQSLRQSLQRIALELQESGRDSNGVLQVAIVNGTTDILRFSVPICACGTSAIDEDGNVKSWGAPVTWGDAGCSTDYPVEANNKVDICHLPPGNPENTQDLNVSVNAVKAHLAHGDYIGECSECSPTNYTNRKVEYSLDNTGRMLRKVLDDEDDDVNSLVAGQFFTNFQASFNQAQTTVILTAQLSRTASQNREIIITGTREVILRNQ